MNKWMQQAYSEALNGMNTNEGGPFGAVIVKNNKIIASSHNKVLLTKDPTSHAEINVIREASHVLNSFDLSGCVLYTSCEPCPMCMGAIFWSRIDTVYYGATKQDAAKVGFDDALFYEMLKAPAKSSINFIQMNQEENAELFKKWKNKGDAQFY